MDKPFHPQHCPSINATHCMFVWRRPCLSKHCSMWSRRDTSTANIVTMTPLPTAIPQIHAMCVSNHHTRNGRNNGFSFFHLFESFYLLIRLSDCNDLKRTMVLQTVFVTNMFSSLVPCTRVFTNSCPRTSTNEPSRWPLLQYWFSSLSLFEYVYLVMHWSDFIDTKREPWFFRLSSS
jgi:hypothetical protein